MSSALLAVLHVVAASRERERRAEEEGRRRRSEGVRPVPLVSARVGGDGGSAARAYDGSNKSPEPALHFLA
jgi:hypothetical protein